ncbi:MAG: Smr/MutS family protein [Bacteroidales bacterium]|nr:Smr/MutS family protein [Bacteroidales bacterium]
MTYPQNFEEKIGFDQIRHLLKGYCLSSLGEQLTDSLGFSHRFDEVSRQLDLGAEFVRILREEEHFPDLQLFDLRPALSRIRVEGTWLDTGELFDLRRSLDSLQRVVRFFIKEDPDSQPSPYPRLQQAASETAVFPDIVDRIDQILDKFGHVQDHASPELAAIRKQLSITTAGISRRLHILLRQAQDEGYVEKGLSPSLRDGRLVIPVSPAFKRKIKGIVHEESASGKTVYVEPEELVEANNRIRELEAEEKREIIRILTAITDAIRPLAPAMADAHAFLALIDLSQAKARLALSLNAIRPVLEDRVALKWDQAVHPLLSLSLKKQQKEVVPLDIRLDEKQRIILISGPNAGGKSVCLKTVGLLQYMLQCGLMIPLAESSVTGLFEHIFIDIGDEQSIENDLSTYSSHLLNIKYFIKNSQQRTLLLIDELGSGTEPRIGGAIAQAVLDALNRRKVYGVVTTHYDNLKHFAQDQEGIVNGAMLYDRHQMQALFRLEIGRPGSSFAIEIARKIGLPEDIIHEASELVGNDYIDMDKHLQDIARDKRYWENKRDRVKQMEKDLGRLTEQYQADLAQVRQQRKEILSKAKSEAQEMLDQANAQIENTIRGIKESQAEKEKTRHLRRQLSEFKDQMLDQAQQREQARLEARAQRDKGRYRMPKSQEEKILRKVRRQNEGTPSQSVRKQAAEPLQVGDKVHLKGQEVQGVISEIKGTKAVVLFDSLKTRVSLSQLEKGKATAQEPAPKQKSWQGLGLRTSEEVHRISTHFSPEIDMRGLRADEALQTLKYYLDDAVVVGAPKVRILHGTGTGALRQLVREYVATLPEVVNYHDEHVQMGGSGITVVEFR